MKAVCLSLATLLLTAGCEPEVAQPPLPPTDPCPFLLVLFDEKSDAIGQISQATLRREFLLSTGPCYTAYATDPRQRIGITVIGHADNGGSVAAKRQLALRRANIVIEYLVELGVPREYLCAREQLSEPPIAPTNDPVVQNRYASIVVDKPYKQCR